MEESDFRKLALAGDTTTNGGFKGLGDFRLSSSLAQRTWDFMIDDIFEDIVVVSSTAYFYGNDM